MTVLAQQIPVPPDPGGHMTAAGSLSGPAAVAITVAVLATLLLIVWPLIRALARRLEGGAASVELQAEVDGLRNRVDQLEQASGRLAEVEERLEFAERMLAQAREPDRLQR